jgi:thiaminase/transcriptional activator TenA
MADTTPTGFCARAWSSVAPLVDAIAAHPFNRQLEDGRLSGERFAFYLTQDARYLVGFARALATAATRCPEPEDAPFLVESSHTALVVERSLHSEYLSALGAGVDGVPLSPTCLAYSSYLEAVAANRPFPVAAAALLPCFWVYHHVGTGILGRVGDLRGHRYERWVATYADPGFAESTAAMRALVDRAAAAAGPGTEPAMLEAFTRATEYEWLFWESAWTMETWPTAAFLAATGAATAP